MSVDSSTRRHLEDHLGQAEFSLKVVANFECLHSTPAHEAVRAALAQVAVARTWVCTQLQTTNTAVVRNPAQISARERLTCARRRLGRMIP